MSNRPAPLRRLLVPCAFLAAGAWLLGMTCTPMTRAVRVASGLSAPTWLTAPPDDPRLFVVELTGLVKIVENGAVRATPFLDLRGKIATGGEQGLLGLAFPPDFDDTGEFYVYYVDAAGDSVLSRFLVGADPNRAAPTSERIVLRVDQPAGRTNHKGGTIAFSPVDGMLYWALGDGGGSNDPDNLAQNGQSLLGKMLRLDVGGGPASTYAIPSDNPFVGGGDGVRDEIWALGFRNPFRFGFDAVTGDLWIGDVGQNQREEIDFEPAGDPGGRNYGWKVHEGTLCHLPQPGLPCESPSGPDRFTFPIHEYPTHVNGTCSITGGTVYRGRRFPTLVGAYVFSDYCSDRVEALRPDGTIVDLSAGMRVDAGAVDGVVAIGEDGFGELYLVSIGSGDVHRLE